MSTHFKWYPAEAEVVVPFNARYSFPSQANKAIKMTPRIPPKNAGTFSPGNVIRLEFPAQGYMYNIVKIAIQAKPLWNSMFKCCTTQTTENFLMSVSKTM